MLPVFVERCREWKHNSDCTQVGNKSIGTWTKEQDPLCACGQGKIPKDFDVTLPHWNTAKQHCVRAAISPLYFVPYVDKFPQELHGPPGACGNCRKSPEVDGVRLSACNRCKAIKYCSKACQKEDWPKHKRSCRA